MKIIFFLAFFLLCVYINAYDSIYYKICFYNFENLFDIYDDPLTQDDEFTPNGIRAWTTKKFNTKLLNLYKVVAALNDNYPAIIIGACEVENKYVLDRLTKTTPLNKLNYSYVHYESSDSRGIDVALLFRKQFVSVLNHKKISMSFHSRDILYANCLINNSFELHVFVCHFPSRYGGAGATDSKRTTAANILKNEINDLLKIIPDANIVVMGDFNDEPDDYCLKNIICADNTMINLADKKGAFSVGTIKHGALWSVFDQILINTNLYNSASSENIQHIACFDFLFLVDEKFGGKKLFRTYSGYKYLGGFSDHLPVFFKIILEN